MLIKAVGLRGAVVLQTLDRPVRLFAVSPPYKVFLFSFVYFSCPFTLFSRLSFSELQTRTKKKPVWCLSTHSHVPGENGKQRLLSQLLRELSVTPLSQPFTLYFLGLLLRHSLSPNKVDVASAS